MLKIIIPKQESYDDNKSEFIYTEERILLLEHSLISISKWESIHHKPFISTIEKTIDETISYICCMSIKDIDIKYIENITHDNHIDIKNYINDQMTATTISKNNQTPNREVITSELIYYWMINFNIPFKYEQWHLNRLLTLINICNIKNQPPKKMSKAELATRNSQLNAQRKAMLNSGG